MYNLLVTATENAWNSNQYEYDKGRFLEYTNEHIAAAFKGLNSTQIETIKSYPCLFAYEGDDKDTYVGDITSIVVKPRSMVIEFKLRNHIPAIPFSELKAIDADLDIRKWEMNRTHWAVKEENLFERLIKAKLLDPTLIDRSLKQNKPISFKPNSPKVSTVQGFIGKVLAIDKAAGTEVFYRGHSVKAKYKLEPSLFRKDENGNYLYLDNEHILYRELIVSNSVDFYADVYTLDRLVRMQHYSLPTRLLDITSNPLIALYFACRSNPDEVGEVIIFSTRRDKVKYFDSDVAACIANLARLPKSEKDNIDFGERNFNQQIAIRRLTHFIREEKPFFEPKILPEDLRRIVCIKGKKSNDRITSQSGAFLLFGLDAVLDEKGTEDIKLDRISIANKTAILRELDLLNINESTVFPYIENSARYVASKYKFDREKEMNKSD